MKQSSIVAVLLYTSQLFITAVSQQTKCSLVWCPDEGDFKYVCDVLKGPTPSPTRNEDNDQGSNEDENIDEDFEQNGNGNLTPSLDYIGEPPHSKNLLECQGHCEDDWDCQFGLNCYKKEGSVPGCTGTPRSTQVNFCYKPPDNELVIRADATTNDRTKLDVCEGHCASDRDCKQGLRCFRRSSTNQSVPGCTGRGTSGVAYCINPELVSYPTNFPSSAFDQHEATPSPMNLSTTTPTTTEAQHSTSEPEVSPTGAPTEMALKVSTNWPSVSPIEMPTSLLTLNPTSHQTNPVPGVSSRGPSAVQTTFPSTEPTSNPTSPFEVLKTIIPVEITTPTPVNESTETTSVPTRLSGVNPNGPSIDPTTAEPTKISFEYVDEPPFNHTLGQCEGRCSTDSDCTHGLVCFEKTADNVDENPGNCGGTGFAWMSYCYRPEDDDVLVVNDHKEKLGLCEGICETDDDCEGNLRCSDRVGWEAVPGCRGKGMYGYNYCYITQYPTMAPASQEPFSLSPDSNISATTSPSVGPTFYVGEPPHSSDLGQCEGQCSSDSDCHEGLTCFVRTHDNINENPGGCSLAGFQLMNYCYAPRHPTPAPSKNWISEDGGTLSPIIESSLKYPSSSPSRQIPSESTIHTALPTIQATTDRPTSSSSLFPDAGIGRPDSTEIPSFIPSYMHTNIPTSLTTVAVDGPSSTPVYFGAGSPTLSPSHSRPSGVAHNETLSPSTTPMNGNVQIQSNQPSNSKQSNKGTDQPSATDTKTPTVAPFGLTVTPTIVKDETKNSLHPSRFPPSVPPREFQSVAPTDLQSQIPTKTYSPLPSAISADEPTETPSYHGDDGPSMTPGFFPWGTTSVVPSKSPFDSTADFSSQIPTFGPTPAPEMVLPANPSTVPYNFPSLYPSSASPTISPTPICKVTGSSRINEIKAKIEWIYVDQSHFPFDDNTSPESLAIEWLTQEDTFHICPDDSNLFQRYALTLLYFYLGGNSWGECTTQHCSSFPFLSGVGECWWEGIVCVDGEVKEIHLNKRNLTGQIPEMVHLLKPLEILVMDDNQLSGSIPKSLGTLRNLKVVDLDNNMLSGHLPDSLFDASTIQVLDIDSNMLSGTLPTRIGEFRELYFLQLDKNNFEGDIPSELSELSNLKYLSLFKNNFTSSIPPTLCGSGLEIYADCTVCSSHCCKVCLN